MKLRVHNLFEAKALIKEMTERGEDCYELRIFSHAGEYLGTNMGSDKVMIFFYPDDDKGGAQ